MPQAPHTPSTIIRATYVKHINRTEDDPLVPQLGYLIYALGIAAGFVAITGYRDLGEMSDSPLSLCSQSP